MHSVSCGIGSTYTDALLEGLNGLFQAVCAKACGYRNTATFTTMIYMIGSPASAVLKSTRNVKEPKSNGVVLDDGMKFTAAQAARKYDSAARTKTFNATEKF